MGTGVMAKQKPSTVKITGEMLRQLKTIHLATGEKINAYVARVLAPILAKDYKKALEQIAKAGEQE